MAQKYAITRLQAIVALLMMVAPILIGLILWVASANTSHALTKANTEKIGAIEKLAQTQERRADKEQAVREAMCRAKVWGAETCGAFGVDP